MLQEVMETSRFYDKYRGFLNLMAIETPTIRSTRDMLVMSILLSLYGDEVVDEMFVVYRENRKSMRLNLLIEMELYGNCLLYTSPSPRDQRGARMPSSA